MLKGLGKAAVRGEWEAQGKPVRRGPEDDQKIMDLAPGTEYLDSDGDVHVRPTGGRIEDGQWKGYSGTINAEEFQESRALPEVREKIDVSSAEFKPGYVTYWDPDNDTFKLTDDWGAVPDKRFIVNDQGEFLTSFVDVNRAENNQLIYYDPNHVTSVEGSNLMPVFGEVFQPESEAAQQFIGQSIIKQAQDTRKQGWSHYGQYRYFEPGEEIPGQYQPVSKDQVAGAGGLYYDSAAPDTGLSTWAGKDTEKYFGSALQVVGTVIATAAGWTGIGGVIGTALSAAGGAYAADQSEKEWWEGAAVGAVSAYLGQFGVAGAVAEAGVNKLVYYENDFGDLVRSALLSQGTSWLGNSLGDSLGNALGNAGAPTAGQIASRGLTTGALNYMAARLQGLDERAAWYSAGTSVATTTFSNWRNNTRAGQFGERLSEGVLPKEENLGFLNHAENVMQSVFDDVRRLPQQAVRDAYTTLDSLAGGTLPDLSGNEWWSSAGVPPAQSGWAQMLKKIAGDAEELLPESWSRAAKQSNRAWLEKRLARAEVQRVDLERDLKMLIAEKEALLLKSGQATR